MHWRLHCERLVDLVGVPVVRLRTWPGTFSALALGDPLRYVIDGKALTPSQRGHARLGELEGDLLAEACGGCHLAAALDGDPSDEGYLGWGIAMYEVFLEQQRSGLQRRLDPDQVQRLLREQRTLQLWLIQPDHQRLVPQLLRGIEIIEEVRRAQDPARTPS